MRSEREMLDLIIGTAKSDERIRAVIMNGSRVNPNAKRDLFQDYDIVYLVTDVAPFINDCSWISRFGEIMILQMPETMEDPPPSNHGGFIYLMQFADGNRIDLSLYPLACFNKLNNDSLSVLLLEKDGIIEPFAPPNESSYLPSPPTAKLFSDCCNEFWWVCPYVAKGLWREEITYAKHMLDTVVREQLMKMLAWHVGVNTQFSSGIGKLGKHLQQRLEPSLWDMLKKTYADADSENTWNALHTTCNLFRVTARHVAEHYGYDYLHAEVENVSSYLSHVQTLPKDAKEIC